MILKKFLPSSRHPLQTLMYRTFYPREGKRKSLPLPSLLGSHERKTGGSNLKNGRETGGRSDYPSRASALCTKAFWAKTGGREGLFQMYSRPKNFFEPSEERLRAAQRLSPDGSPSGLAEKIIISILTAIATALGVTSCMG